MIQWWWLLVELVVILLVWFYIAWRAVGQSEEYQSIKRAKQGDFGWPQDVMMKDPDDAA